MNSFGRNFRVSIFGESHGTAVGVTLDGVPAGIGISTEDFECDLARRRSGAFGTTPRSEADMPEIISGVFDGHSTGAPLTVIFRNTNTRSGDYASLVDHPRPSHADLVAAQKFNSMNDPRGGGHFSGRITLGLVAAGVVAKKILAQAEFSTRITNIGGCDRPEEFESIIADAIAEGDSVGGTIQCCITGIPSGLGEPFFNSVESLASHLLFSIPAVRGVEFGAGFAAASMRGSQHNDMIVDDKGTTATNNAGGVVGGITNGNPIVVRVAVKPTASISRPQQTFNLHDKKVETLEIQGRHDACIALRAAVVVESAMAITLADLKLTQNR